VLFWEFHGDDTILIRRKLCNTDILLLCNVYYILLERAFSILTVQIVGVDVPVWA